MSIDFYADLVALMPKIRVQALALSRNRAAADGLVQDAAMHALVARDSFTPGTNFRASMYRILRNRFISGLRKRRDVIRIEDAPLAALTVPDSTEERITLQELQRALGNLPPA